MNWGWGSKIEGWSETISSTYCLQESRSVSIFMTPWAPPHACLEAAQTCLTLYFSGLDFPTVKGQTLWCIRNRIRNRGWGVGGWGWDGGGGWGVGGVLALLIFLPILTSLTCLLLCVPKISFGFLLLMFAILELYSTPKTHSFPQLSAFLCIHKEMGTGCFGTPKSQDGESLL